MHYLDDIFGIQTPALVWAQHQTAGKTLVKLGLSAKEAKDRPPATTQTLLGLEFDSIKQEARILMSKIEKYAKFAWDIINTATRTVTKRRLFSLTGKVRCFAMHCRPLASYARDVEIYGHHRNYKWYQHINITSPLRKYVLLIIDALQILRPRET